jgi:hypothetical protein
MKTKVDMWEVQIEDIQSSQKEVEQFSDITSAGTFKLI